MVIGIRREDKNKWERRVPLIPEDLADLGSQLDLHILVQPSTIRVFSDDEYRAAGIEVSGDLSPARVIFAVKEVPAHLLQPGAVYAFFAHVTKGQPHNMPMLRRLIELGCSLVDYERIADDQMRRLIFFGRHAGYAGMIETLWAIGQRLALQGTRTPLAEVKHAFQYEDLAAAKSHLTLLGEEIASKGLASSCRRLIFGFSGYGNVSSGAQEVFACLKPVEATVVDLPAVAGQSSPPASSSLVKVVFREEHMVRPKDPSQPFQLNDYFANPERYTGCFEDHLPFLDVLVNAIYWEPRFPRLVSRAWARNNYLWNCKPRLQVIGDISCDVGGSIELTVQVTEPDKPCYVYLPQEDRIHEGVIGGGPAIMAVDNLPCEIPRESSRFFSQILREMVPPMVAADWSAEFTGLAVPPYLKRAVIVHNGALTPSYRYLEKHLEDGRR
jgi:saccharopine dehydrogenase (NAD+, L-lysine forming)